MSTASSGSGIARQDLSQDQHIEGLPIGTRGGILVRHTFPADGEYKFSVENFGLGKYVPGEKLEYVAEAGPGNFIFVPPYVPHQEINASTAEPLECVLVRSDKEAVVVNLDIEPVENHHVGRIERRHGARLGVPGSTHAAVRIEPDKLDPLHGAVRVPPVDKLHDVLLRCPYPGRCQGLVELAFGHRHADFDVIHVLRHGPEVSTRVVDDVGGRRRKAKEEADLDSHEDDGEYDADHRDGEARFVVQKIADGE